MALLPVVGEVAPLVASVVYKFQSVTASANAAVVTKLAAMANAKRLGEIFFLNDMDVIDSPVKSKRKSAFLQNQSTDDLVSA
jgi:hypothetical protein